MEKETRLLLRISENEKNMLRELAKKDGERSMSSLIREWIKRQWYDNLS